MPRIKDFLVENLTLQQAKAVKSGKRRVLVVAGAGSGKTEVMARRIAWWVGVKGVSKDIGWIEKITSNGQEVCLGNMYFGTIYGFCIAKIREFWQDEYHNCDILDEASRTALIFVRL